MKIKIKKGVAILEIDKIDFKTKAITRDKEGPISFLVIPFLGICQEKPKTLNSKDILIHIFITPLFTITKI